MFLYNVCTHALSVEVQLDEPLWVPRAGPQEVAMEIMALCLQLDSLILASTHNVSSVPSLTT